MTTASAATPAESSAERAAQPTALTEAERHAWEQRGWFLRSAVFGPAELLALRAGAEEAAHNGAALAETGNTYFLDGKRFVDCDHITIQFEHQPGSTEVKVIEPVHALAPSLDALIRDARILAPMRGLLGTEHLALWTDKLNLKRPGVGSGFGWHQDSPYWVHDCAHSVDDLPNVMVTFDDADPDNGCLRFIDRSHTRGCLPGTDDGTQLGGFYTDPGAFDPADEIAVTAPAGSLVFFSPHIIHGSQPNLSASPRRAMVITYQPADHPALKDGRVHNLG